MEQTTNGAMINNNKISYFKQPDAFSPFTSEDNVPLLSLNEKIILDKKHYQVVDINEYDDCVIYTVKLIQCTGKP